MTILSGVITILHRTRPNLLSRLLRRKDEAEYGLLPAGEDEERRPRGSNELGKGPAYNLDRIGGNSSR